MRALEEIQEDIRSAADELNVDYDYNDWADRLIAVADEIEQRIELEKRIKRMKGTGSSGGIKIKNLVRDRRNSKEMRRILEAGGTHYRGQKILGSKNDPYIKWIERKYVKAELTEDLDHRLGCKPESD